MKPARQLLRAFLLFWCVTFCTAASAQNTLWQVRSETATIYLLGSVHLLRHSDFPLDPALDAAYERTDLLVTELDLNAADPIETQALINRIGRISNGDLEDWMGAIDYRRAHELAADMEVDLDRLRGLKPWLAAITILQLQLARLGFSPDLGIDFYFAGRAKSDGKPVLGLETMEFQLEQFDSLSQQRQSEFLLQSLEEAEDIPGDIEAMVKAWKSGDAAALSRVLEEGFTGYPELYERLVKNRNSNWLPHLLELLNGDKDVLVVVGALHLVGTGSVIEMLEQRGFAAQQL